mmetsp:Transcript_16118/g.39780  ORF Transcript_16118/g.39780 Transcript_16118/m.39780 type:complete len:201 (-) Transcript_16118:287-889(-)
MMYIASAAMTTCRPCNRTPPGLCCAPTRGTAAASCPTCAATVGRTTAAWCAMCTPCTDRVRTSPTSTSRRGSTRRAASGASPSACRSWPRAPPRATTPPETTRTTATSSTASSMPSCSKQRRDGLSVLAARSRRVWCGAPTSARRCACVCGAWRRRSPLRYPCAPMPTTTARLAIATGATCTTATATCRPPKTWSVCRRG